MTGCPGEIASPSSATKRPTTPSAGATSVVFANFASRFGDRRLGKLDLGVRNGASSCRPGLGLGVDGFKEGEDRLGLGERGRAFVKLLLAGEFPGRQGRGPLLLLLREQQICLGDADILRRDVDFFLARAGVDIRSIGFRRGRVRLWPPRRRP